jgi:hypothetical protein
VRRLYKSFGVKGLIVYGNFEREKNSSVQRMRKGQTIGDFEIHRVNCG